MIWIYEELTKTELKSLQRLNPMMDYDNNGRAHIYKTSCMGFEIKNGMHQEIRKIRFFNINQTRQGFICDDIKKP